MDDTELEKVNSAIKARQEILRSLAAVERLTVSELGDLWKSHRELMSGATDVRDVSTKP